mmetsp:Transcript_44788/g.72983  ORF Transcript_44788/g.72983 Transcript_44788/m.72983 type:complete len:233 (+) Transcript_44788:129-827(+)
MQPPWFEVRDCDIWLVLIFIWFLTEPANCDCDGQPQRKVDGHATWGSQDATHANPEGGESGCTKSKNASTSSVLICASPTSNTDWASGHATATADHTPHHQHRLPRIHTTHQTHIPHAHVHPTTQNRHNTRVHSHKINCALSACAIMGHRQGSNKAGPFKPARTRRCRRGGRLHRSVGHKTATGPLVAGGHAGACARGRTSRATKHFSECTLPPQAAHNGATQRQAVHGSVV